MVKYCGGAMFLNAYGGSSGFFTAKIWSISPLLTHFTTKFILESYDPELIYLVEFKNEEVLFSFHVSSEILIDAFINTLRHSSLS